MRIKVYKEFGALNSKSVFEAFEKGVLANRDTLVDTYEEADVVVIWSVLFHGRMARNKQVWEQAQKDDKPVVVIEVGTLKRNVTWRVGINGVNRDAEWAEFWDIGPTRHKLLGVEVDPWQDDTKEFITIATQRPDSLQWTNMPSVESWLHSTITKIRDVSKRTIVVRPHPRDHYTNWQNVHHMNPGIYFDVPKAIGDYDKVNFEDILQRTHILVNYCTSPAVEAVLRGVPVVVGEPSMAWDMRTEIENIENPNKPERSLWVDKLCHTEWFECEIERGEPWERLRRLV